MKQVLALDLLQLFDDLSVKHKNNQMNFWLNFVTFKRKNIKDEGFYLRSGKNINSLSVVILLLANMISKTES